MGVLSGNNRPTSSGGGVLSRIRQQEARTTQEEDNRVLKRSDFQPVLDPNFSIPSVISGIRPIAGTEAPQSIYDVPEEVSGIRPIAQVDKAPAEIKPGRDIPVLGAGLRALDATGNFIEENPVTRWGVSLGRDIVSTGGAGTVAGFYKGAGGILSKLPAVAGKIAPKLEPAATKLAYGNSLGQRLAREVATEGLAGYPIGVGQSLASGNQLDESLKEGLYGSGLGIGAGAGGVLAKAGAKKVVNSAASSLLRGTIENSKLLDDPLALPAGRPKALREGATPSGSPIANPYTFGLPEGMEQTTERTGNIKSGFDDLASINRELADLDTGYQRAINDQYKYLKESAKQDRGGEKGNLIRNELTGEVVDMYGNISTKPIWYQQALKDLNTTYLNNKQLYELAKKHVDEGFHDDGGFIPSWKEQVNYDETVQALSSVRDELRGTLKQEGLGLTPEKLKTDNFKVAPKQPEAPSHPVSNPSDTNVQPEVKKPVQAPQTHKNQVEIDKFDSELKAYRDHVNDQVQRGVLFKDQANKQIKGRAMEVAAQKRKLIQGDSLIPVEGGLTGKELQAVTDRLRTNYVGKKVIVNGKEGKVKGNSFGKVTVEFPDGSTGSFHPDFVRAKDDIDSIISKQQAEKDSQAVSIPDKVNPPEEVKKPMTVVERAESKIAENPNQTQLLRPLVDDATKVSGSLGEGTKVDEVRFTERLKEQGKVDPVLEKMLSERMVEAPRTSNERNIQLATELIRKRGADELYSSLIQQRMIVHPIDGTAARLLARYFSEIGDFDKAYNLVSKTGVSGREAGQFLQTLSQWKQLSAEGVLKTAERQLNRRAVKGVEEQSLSPEQAEHFGGMGNDLKALQDLEEAAKDITQMLAKKDSPTLTPDELAKLEQFKKNFDAAQSQVKKLQKATEEANKKTIKEVESIEPQYRKRDQVVDYLEAQADQAKAELARRRNLGFARKLEEPEIVLHAKIGAAFIARKLVKYTDWADAMIKTGITDNLPALFVKSGDRFRKANGMPNLGEVNTIIEKAIKNRQLDEQTANSLRVAVTEIGFAADDAKRELTRDLQSSLRKIGEVTGGEYIKTYLTSGMLLNARTIGRNMVGLIQQLTLDKVNKAFSAPVDWTASKFTGERTVKFLTDNQAKLWKSFAEGGIEGATGVSKTGTLTGENIHPETFRSKWNPFRYFEKATGASLESLDRAGYDMAYGEVMATYGHYLGKEKGLTNKQIKEQMPKLIEELDERIGVIADEAATKAVYQDRNMLSILATGLQKGLNYPTDAAGRFLRSKGMPAWMSPEGFGMGDIVLFFARTPANLIVRGLEYSPIGYLNSLRHVLGAFGKNGVFDQRKFALSMGKATTGTLGLTMLGWDLYNKGILTGAPNKDTDIRSLEESTDKKGYQVNVSALWRYISSGLDANEAKPRENDNMKDYAWLQPAAISLGMGVSAAKAVEEGKKKAKEEGIPLSKMKVIESALLGGLQTVLETPMLQGTKKVVDAISDLSAGKGTQKTQEVFTGVPSMAIPTVFGQTRRGKDNYMRETYVKGDPLKTSLNMAKNKIPGMSESLPVSYDVLGQPRKYSQTSESGDIAGYANQLLQPFSGGKLKTSQDAKFILDLLEQTNDKSVVPRKQDRYVQVKDPKTGKQKYIPLTTEQYSTLQKDVGTKTVEALRKYISKHPNDSNDKKVKEINSILDKVGTETRNKLKTDLGYPVKKK